MLQFTERQKKEIDYLKKFTINFCDLLRERKVKEVQCKMLQFYLTQYMRERFLNKEKEETIGDMLGANVENFDKLKHEAGELLDIINVKLPLKGQHCKKVFLDFLDIYQEKFLTDDVM